VVSNTGDDNFDNSITELENRGFNRTDRIYLMFVDTTAAGICGIGTLWNDDQASGANRNNRGPSYARIDAGCWGGAVAAHELMHNLGGVQNSAPHASGGFHCVDEYDRMCYSDEPNHPTMRIVCAAPAHDLRFDCGHDDYFHTAPAGGSYLATHWNTANQVFLIRGGAPPPCPDSATEPDDGAGRARSIAVWSTARRAFCLAGDQDWVSFATVAGKRYRIETHNLAASVDTVLDLYQPNGTKLIASDDNGNGGRASRIEFSATSTGPYLVKARDRTGDSSRSSTYDLLVSTVGGDLTLSPTSGPKDTTITVTLRGYQPGERVTITWGSGRNAKVRKKVTVSAAGDLTTTITPPSKTKFGNQKVSGVGNQGSRASAVFTVTRPAGEDEPPDTAESASPESPTGEQPAADDGSEGNKPHRKPGGQQGDDHQGRRNGKKRH
jgi:hypothetical protein